MRPARLSHLTQSFTEGEPLPLILPDVERVTAERPTRIRMCTHSRGHAWKTVVVPTRVLGIIGPWVKLTCKRCNVTVDAEVVRVTEPLLPNRRGRQAAHAHTKKGTHR
jgi:hypothetical protein